MPRLCRIPDLIIEGTEGKINIIVMFDEDGGMSTVFGGVLAENGLVFGLVVVVRGLKASF